MGLGLIKESNKTLKNKTKTKNSFVDQDISSAPETIISNSVNFIKENLNSNLTSADENLNMQIKVLQRNLEIYLSEKNFKNKNSYFKLKNNIDDYKRENDLIIPSLESEKFKEFIELNIQRFNNCKSFLIEFMNLNSTWKAFLEIILNEFENNHIEMHSKFIDLNEKLNVAELYSESIHFFFKTIKYKNGISKKTNLNN